MMTHAEPKQSVVANELERQEYVREELKYCTISDKEKEECSLCSQYIDEPSSVSSSSAHCSWCGDIPNTHMRR